MDIHNWISIIEFNSVLVRIPIIQRPRSPNSYQTLQILIVIFSIVFLVGDDRFRTGIRLFTNLVLPS